MYIFHFGKSQEHFNSRFKMAHLPLNDALLLLSLLVITMAMSPGHSHQDTTTSSHESSDISRKAVCLCSQNCINSFQVFLPLVLPHGSFQGCPAPPVPAGRHHAPRSQQYVSWLSMSMSMHILSSNVNIYDKALTSRYNIYDTIYNLVVVNYQCL